MVDVQRLRELAEKAFQWPPSNLDAFAEAAQEALPELLAIAEAYNAAQVGKVDMACAGDAVVVDGLNNPGAIVKQTVRLVRVVGEAK